VGFSRQGIDLYITLAKFTFPIGHFDLDTRQMPNPDCKGVGFYWNVKGKPSLTVWPLNEQSIDLSSHLANQQDSQYSIGQFRINKTHNNVYYLLVISGKLC